MARASLGPIVSSIAGSIGATTFRNARSGLVVSNRPLRPDRASPAQLEHRRIMSASAAAWTLLDADIKTAWGNLARQEPIPSFFSRGRHWTGRQLFTCFFLQAERQLTPLPARWLPTPPIFFLSNNYNLSIFNPFYHVYDPAEPPYWPTGWYSDTFVMFGRPLSLNPSIPSAYATDFPSTGYLAFSPLDSFSIPKRWTCFYPLTPPYQPATGAAPEISGVYGCYDSSFAIPNLIAPPPGFTPGMTTKIPRSFASWINLSGLSDERLYYSGIQRVPGLHSLSGEFIPEPEAIMNTFETFYLRQPLTTASNYPKTEV